MVPVTAGMSRGELLGLRWSDLALDGTATLRASVAKDTLRVGDTIRNLEERQGGTIRLSARTVDALKAHRARQAEEKLRAGPLY